MGRGPVGLQIVLNSQRLYSQPREILQELWGLWHSQKQDGRPLHIPANPWLEAGYLLVLPVVALAFPKAVELKLSTLRPISVGWTHATYYFAVRRGFDTETTADRTAKCTNYIHLFRHHFLVPRFTYRCSCSSAVLRATLVRPLCISYILFVPVLISCVWRCHLTASNQHPSCRIT